MFQVSSAQILLLAALAFAVFSHSLVVGSPSVTANNLWLLNFVGSDLPRFPHPYQSHCSEMRVLMTCRDSERSFDSQRQP